MRILQVIEFFSPSMGGSAQVAYQIARQLAALGHDVTVVSSNYSADGSRFPQEDFNTQLFPAIFSRAGFYVSPGLMGWAREYLSEYDIIHLHNVRTFQNMVIGREARRLGIPYVLSAHGSLPLLEARKGAKKAYDLLFGQQLVRGAARLIAVSPAEKRQFIAYGIPAEKTALIYNGLDLAQFAQLPPGGQLRRKLGVPAGASLVLFLGRIHRIKGIDHLIAAFARMAASNENAVLLVAGPDDGDLSRLQSMAAGLGLTDRVLFPGGLYGEDKLAALADADVLAAPSRYEIFGLAPFEALMCGTPVVVTADSAAAEILQQAGAAYMAPYGDAEALADALVSALTEQERSRKMVQAGQAYARNHLQWPAIAGQLLTIYSAALSPAGLLQSQVSTP